MTRPEFLRLTGAVSDPPRRHTIDPSDFERRWTIRIAIWFIMGAALAGWAAIWAAAKAIVAALL